MVSDATLEHRRAVLHELQRRHIIDGFVRAATDKGYADVTIADIVGDAHVSKRTFYEHFADKQAVYLALHAEVAEGVTGAFQSALRRTAGHPTETRIEDLAHSYLDAMASHPTWLAQIRIEPQIAARSAREASQAAARQLTPLLGTVFADQDGGYTDSLIAAAFAGTVSLVANAAHQGPSEVRNLEPTIRELWLRLSRPNR